MCVIYHSFCRGDYTTGITDIKYPHSQSSIAYMSALRPNCIYTYQHWLGFYLDGLLGNLPSQTVKIPSTMFVITASNSTQPKPYVAQQYKLSHLLVSIVSPSRLMTSKLKGSLLDYIWDKAIVDRKWIQTGWWQRTAFHVEKYIFVDLSSWSIF